MEELIYIKTMKDGRVKALNRWRTGAEYLIYQSLAAFERAKAKVEGEQTAPTVGGYTVAE